MNKENPNFFSRLKEIKRPTLNKTEKALAPFVLAVAFFWGASEIDKIYSQVSDGIDQKNNSGEVVSAEERGAELVLSLGEIGLIIAAASAGAYGAGKQLFYDDTFIS